MFAGLYNLFNSISLQRIELWLFMYDRKVRINFKQITANRTRNRRFKKSASKLNQWYLKLHSMGSVKQLVLERKIVCNGIAGKPIVTQTNTKGKGVSCVDSGVVPEWDCCDTAGFYEHICENWRDLLELQRLDQLAYQCADLAWFSSSPFSEDCTGSKLLSTPVLIASPIVPRTLPFFRSTPGRPQASPNGRRRTSSPGPIVGS
jgi:hypothetical protein